jgi:hypothetical protein
MATKGTLSQTLCDRPKAISDRPNPAEAMGITLPSPRTLRRAARCNPPPR